MSKPSSRTPSDRNRPEFIESLEGRLMMRSSGIDVSSYQGTITWSSVYSAGIRFAWAKASEGLTVNDSTFTANETNGTNASVIMGAYHFAHYELGHTASDEADHFIAQASAYLKPGFLRPVVDVEENTSMTKTQVSTWVNAFCNRVLSVTGCRPIVYTSPSIASTKLDSTVTQWALWMANYNGQDPQTGGPSGTTPWASWNFWQYSQSGSVSGISGAVDRDVANGGTPDYVIPNYVSKSTHFSVGQAVHVNTASGLKGWDSYASNGSYLVEPNGKGATIVSGPVYIAGYERWEVKYNGESVTRWSAEDFLSAGAGTAAVQAAPALAAAPASSPASSSKAASPTNSLLASNSSLFGSTPILA